MIEIAIPNESAELESALRSVPDAPGVFLVWPHTGKPYVARTNALRKRLRRTLRSLAASVERVGFEVTGSRLESQFRVWELARRHLGPGYREAIRLRLPPWVKLTIANEFPRTLITTKIGRSEALYFGPFRTRAAAARFDSAFLDLFQLRRCPENLVPAPDHPGCMYGEMGRCLRPCQMAVGPSEYRTEATRVAEFLRTGGRSLLTPAESARDRLSAEMDFEGAALMHQRCQRIAEVLAERDEMARELNSLHAVAVLPAAGKDAVMLGWLRDGYWRGFTPLEFGLADGRAASLDTRLREMASAIGAAARVTSRERAEQLAILARWRYAGWCDGELLMVDDWGKIPYRRLVNAVSRAARGKSAVNPQSQPRPGNHS